MFEPAARLGFGADGVKTKMPAETASCLETNGVSNSPALRAGIVNKSVESLMDSLDRTSRISCPAMTVGSRCI